MQEICRKVSGILRESFRNLAEIPGKHPQLAGILFAWNVTYCINVRNLKGKPCSGFDEGNCLRMAILINVKFVLLGDTENKMTHMRIEIIIKITLIIFDT